MDRILTTHAGSLVRPREVLRFLDAIDAGEAYERIGGLGLKALAS